MTTITDQPRLRDLTREMQRQNAATEDKAMGLVKWARCLALAKGDAFLLPQIARTYYPLDTRIGHLAKTTAVDPGSTTGTWADDLAYAAMSRDFIGSVLPQTILGKLFGVRRVPFSTSMLKSSGAGALGSWVGQGKPIPVGRLTLDLVSLADAKLAAIIVLTDDLVALSAQNGPEAEVVMRSELERALTALIDYSFIDPTIAAVADQNPASISFGAFEVNSTGSSAAQITADCKSMFAHGYANDVTFEYGAFVMKPSTRLYLGTVLNASNAVAFPSVLNSNSFFGLPIIASQAVPTETDDKSWIALIDAPSVLLAIGNVEIVSSNQASIQMDTAPSAEAANQVSLWQANLTGLRGIVHANWALSSAAGCVLLENVAY